ncbi:MAG: hypothetical protein PVI07_01905 [Anaerolineae bacterium]
MVFQTPRPNCPAIELAERTTWLHPGRDTYQRRPPFIRDLHPVDESGATIDFEIETYPHRVYFTHKLVRWNTWWFSMNDDDVGRLAQYNHLYLSSLDGSPLWDYGIPVESPDLNTYLCVQMGSLAMVVEALGRMPKPGCGDVAPPRSCAG